MATPVGDAITCRKFVEYCPIVIGGRTLLSNSVVFTMLGYDIILGVDWLSKYCANLNFFKKFILFLKK